MDLIWSPTVLEHSGDEEHQMYLEFSRSGCIRGGGSSIEVALEVLYKSGGNLMLAIEKLLSLNKFPLDPTNTTLGGHHQRPPRPMTPMTPLRERQQQAPKRMRASDASSTNTSTSTTSTTTTTSSNSTTSTTPPDHHHSQEGMTPTTPLIEQFACKVCGRVFPKIKSRSAHMKRHKNERYLNRSI